MRYTQGTFIPNELLDTWLTKLKPTELRILLVIIRQTVGWKLPNGERKRRDRISNSQFVKKANVSDRNISPSIQTLINNNLIQVSGYNGEPLNTPEKRRGRRDLYYECTLSTSAMKHKKKCSYQQKEPQKSAYNKRNTSKETKTKEPRRIGKETDWQRIQYLMSS